MDSVSSLLKKGDDPLETVRKHLKNKRSEWGRLLFRQAVCLATRHTPHRRVVGRPVRQQSCHAERRHGGHRVGSLIVEAVIASMLMVTATIALAQLARHSAALSSQADQRLAATLAAENMIERLNDLSDDKVRAGAAAVVAEVAEVSGCRIVVDSEPFDSGSGRGLHVRVVASPQADADLRVSLHDWRIAATDAEPEE